MKKFLVYFFMVILEVMKDMVLIDGGFVVM